MLKAISLENYKCFKKQCNLKIAPLTILCGVNSSGKSSLLKSLLMLKQSYENESPTHSMLLSGMYVDNGSFDDVVYHTGSCVKNDDFTLSNSFEIRDTSNDKGRNPVKRQDIISFRELRRIFYQTKNIKAVKSFYLEIRVVVGRPRADVSSFDFFIDSNIIKGYYVTIKLADASGNCIDTVDRYIYVDKGENDREWTLRCHGIPNLPDSDSEIVNNCTCYFSGLQIKNLYIKNMTRNMITTVANILAIFKIAALQTDGISFIAPLRQQPIRRYSLNGDVRGVGISGENMPIVLAKGFNDKRLRTECIPPKEDDGGVVWCTQKASFRDVVSIWTQYFGLGEISLSGNNGLLELQVNGHNLVDVGFGVSQALPIIVEGLTMLQDEILLLEQPEIHLHPELQLKMADFLIALAKHEKGVVVETHSDHFVNRIIRRVMEDSSLVEGENPLIKIYFIDKHDDDIAITDIQIDRYKGVINGTRNFFTQFGSETMNISKIGYERYQMDKNYDENFVRH